METSPKESEDLAYFPDPATDPALPGYGVQLKAAAEKKHPAAEEPMALGTDCFYKKPYESQMPPTLTKTDQVAAGIAFHCSLARVETQNDGSPPALPHPSGRSR